ncbi:unnamed protein product [Peronospora farinosa]|uniref:NAD-dependent epimerase/dehydratase domain-containing protein n=2 Tax=Peronospora farinosa TaxID=134698 RepID=A0AAV0UNZ1_9STRA|nr:unnamed protein product [Peronospora farinosa]
MSSIPSKKLFVFGLGYSASRAAHAFHSIGYQLFRFESSTTHPQSVFLFDGDTWSATNSLSLEKALQGVTHVLVSVPTGRLEGQADPVLAALKEPLIRATKDSIQWVSYLLTIGVYGETNGVEVDESATVGSSVGRSQMRIKAERLWLDSGLPAHVFRIAGIYGPGRGTLTKVRSGTASIIHIPGRKFSRIHVDDIVNILLASAAQPNPGGIYNITSSTVVGEAEKTMSAMAKSFYAESKICANRRIKEELGVQLIYPTYREGFLAQILEEDKLSTAGDVLSCLAASKTLPRLVVLVNIGSLRAEPYLDLRQISFRLSRSIGQPVVPCSFRFSNRVNPNELYGLEAKTFGMYADRISPKTINKVWAAATPTPSMPLTVRVGGCLVDQENAEDTRVAQILLERILAVVDLKTVTDDVNVLVVDHGTPSRDVNEARELVAQALRGLLQRYEHVKLVDTACMERREGAEYDFNDPLLAQALDYYTVKTGIVVCAIMFLSNGRHAGEKGDIKEIIEDVRARHPGVDVCVTEALGMHELLSEIMKDRYRTVLAKETPDYTLPNDK